MHVLIDDDLHGAEEDCAIRVGPERHPVVRPIGGGVVLRRDHDDAGARARYIPASSALPASCSRRSSCPSSCSAWRSACRTGRCRTPGPRTTRDGRGSGRRARCSSTNSGRPAPASGLDFANPGVQQRIDATVHPGVAHLADDAEDRHTRAVLEAARARALHHLDHFRRIALLPQPPRARFPAIPRGNDDHAPSPHR